MNDHFASGTWIVRAGAADEFVQRWQEFLGWTRRDHAGLESASLVRSNADPNRFVSFAAWTSAEDRDAWKQSDGFGQRFSACRELCDEFMGGDYDGVVTI